jgi:hypothetical protein
MPRIKTYKRLEPLAQLGENAELFICGDCYDVSNMNVKDMLTIYEPDILKANGPVRLVSEDVGTWNFNRATRKWTKASKGE